MNHRHLLAPTTHTVELNQIQQLNDRLGGPHDQSKVTADALGIAGELSGRRLPAAAVLEGVFAEGPPSFPYIWGRLRGSDAAAAILAPLHTQALTRLSRNLGFGHHWGL